MSLGANALRSREELGRLAEDEPYDEEYDDPLLLGPGAAAPRSPHPPPVAVPPRQDIMRGGMVVGEPEGPARDDLAAEAAHVMANELESLRMSELADALKRHEQSVSTERSGGPSSHGALEGGPGTSGGSTPKGPHLSKSSSDAARKDRGKKKRAMNPDSMPRPPLKDAEAPAAFVTVCLARQGEEGEVTRHPAPPPAGTRYEVRDRGSCGPRFMRLSLNSLPADPRMLAGSALHMDVLVTPLARMEPGDDPIPVVDMGYMGPPRCARCNAYINPFMRWIDGGKRFVCNLCAAINETPEKYFSKLEDNGLRADHAERPELWSGSVDFVATDAYRVRPPMSPAHVFVIDVSAEAVRSGRTRACCRAADAALGSVAGRERALAGVVTYDTQVHFYALRAHSENYQVVVCPDMSDTYVPPGAAFVPPLAECEQSLRAVLAAIPEVHSPDDAPASAPKPRVATCAGAAILSAARALRGNGGHVHAFLSQRPREGPLQTLERGYPDGLEEDTVLKHLGRGKDLTPLARDCATHQICVSLHVLAPPGAEGPGVDVATLGDLAMKTGGGVRYWDDLRGDDWPAMAADLAHAVSREQGLEALFRMRVSAGLKVESYRGAFFSATDADVDLPQVDADKCVAVTLAHGDAPLHGRPEAYLQAALLYTAPGGARRIRVHNLARAVTPVMQAMYKGADLDAHVAATAKRMCAALPRHSVASLRELALADAASALHKYRHTCALKQQPGQLILPEALKTLPLATSAMLKAAPFRQDLPLDQRAAAAHAVQTASPEALGALLYPRLFRVDRLHADFPSLLEPPGPAPGGGAPAPAACPRRLPDRLMLSAQVLEPEGIYLLDDGLEAVFHVGRQCPDYVVHGVLGEDAAASGARGAQVRELGTPASAALWALLRELQRRRGCPSRIRVLRHDRSEALFFDRLVEDRVAGLPSYMEHLQQLHKRIQTRLS